MLRPPGGVFWLMAAACGCALSSLKTSAVEIGNRNDEVLTAVVAEPEAKAQPSEFLRGDMTPPSPGVLAEQSILMEADKEGEPSDAEADELAAKVFALAAAYPTGTRPGVRTTLLGLVGLLLFFALHVLTQHVRKAPVIQDVLFKQDSGKVTFTGAGSIIAAVFFAAGLLEVIFGPGLGLKRYPTSEFTSPARGGLQAEVGRYLILMSTVGIAVGWVVGAPLLVMEAAAAGFLVGSALSTLGLGLLFSDMKRGLDLAKKLYAFDLKDESAMSDDAQVDPAVLIKLIDRSLQDQKGIEGFLAKKGVPFPEALMSPGLQPAIAEQEKQQTNIVLDVGAFAPLALELQKLQPQQQDGISQDTQLLNLFSAAIQAAQELQQHPEILQQASQLAEQRQTAFDGAAAASRMASGMQSPAGAPGNKDNR